MRSRGRNGPAGALRHTAPVWADSAAAPQLLCQWNIGEPIAIGGLGSPGAGEPRPPGALSAIDDNGLVRRIAHPRSCLVPWLRALAIAAIVGTMRAQAADAPTEHAAPIAEGPYRVEIDAPSDLRAPIAASLGLVRWQHWPDMNADIAERLAAEAVGEATNAAAAEGYFSASVDVAVDRSTRPTVYTVKVVPGEPTRIADVRIDVSGPAVDDTPRGTDAIARLRAGWGLAPGEIFRQSQWTAAKNQALATLRAAPYPAARIVRSEAAIDPDARRAALSIAIDSGPAFRFGDLVTTGLGRYRAAMVENYRSFARGDPYSEATLEQFIRRLNRTGYFSSVQAAIDVDSSTPDDAPVRVAIIEAPARHLEVGLGFSTDVGYTSKVDYRDVNLDRNGLQLLVNGQLDSKIQSGSIRLIAPANEFGWIGTFPLGARRTDIEGLVTRTAYAGTRWNSLDERRERAYSATYYDDEQEPEGAALQRSHATYLEAEQYVREVDNLLSPTRGFMASLQGGGGIPGASTRGFGRVVGRFVAWVPLDAGLELQLRAEGGAVLAPTRDGIPSTLLFRTGGDTTVRGYAFESLGVKEGSATVGGRYYAVASAELIRWVNEFWGVAAFADTGNAGDSIPGFRFVAGYGAGIRVRTPLGPFRVDVAYGEASHEVRLHFSVGLSF